MKLLKPDGRIVYSTCSLNPVENEAVVASALKSNTGKFSLGNVVNNLNPAFCKTSILLMCLLNCTS